MEAKSPVSLTDQEITHVELNLKNASQESLSNDMSRHCKEKLTAGILGLLCLKVTMMVTVTITISPSVIHLENNSSLARTQKEVHNLSSAYHCGRCPNEWLIFSNNCYYFGVEKKNWTESLASCTSKKSNLIYIDDEKEMKFLRFSRSSWIGVSRSSRDHPWLSVNGSAFNMQVKHSSSNESNCVWLSLSGFMAENCGSSLRYNCKHKF